METLPHLLSFVYDAQDDKYKPICIWENPNGPNDFFVIASLARRQLREAEFNSMAGEANIVVGAPMGTVSESRWRSCAT
eukprot:2698807-Pleurochrysis_carterae.AAC.1